jgi:multidrug resistance efflux pump
MAVVDEETRPVTERPAPVQRVNELLRPRPVPAELPAPRDGGLRPRRRLLMIGVAILLATAVIGGGTAWWLEASKWVTTDDAFIDVHMVQVSPQVAGRVAHVLVNDNEEVRAGQLLVNIDPADF